MVKKCQNLTTNFTPLKLDEVYCLLIDRIYTTIKGINPPIKCIIWVSVKTYKYDDATLLPDKNLPFLTNAYQPNTCSKKNNAPNNIVKNNDFVNILKLSEVI